MQAQSTCCCSYYISSSNQNETLCFSTNLKYVKVTSHCIKICIAGGLEGALVRRYSAFIVGSFGKELQQWHLLKAHSLREKH